MGVTLDELLENSGINFMNGGSEKTASVIDAQIDEDELVSALRKYASEEDHTGMRQEAARELAEKTAEIMVIAQTISEINKLASIVDDAETQKVASFIRVAIDKGHSDEDIAEFLEKNAAGRVGRALASVAQGLRRGGARRAAAKLDKVTGLETKLLRDKLVNGSQAEVIKHLNHVEGKVGRQGLVSLLENIKKQGTHLPYPASKYLPKASATGGEFGKFKTSAGKEYSISKDTAKATGIGAAGLGTGLALRGKSKDSGGRGGPVIITR